MRKGFALSASFAYLLSWIFLLLVVIGNTYDRPVLNSIFFFKLDLADIIPTSVPNADLINSIAQSIGLHDFYQILTSELLSGATIALPTEVVTILSVLRITSQIMFGFFLTSAVLAFILIFLTPLAIVSRWWSLPLAIVSFLEMLLILAASIVGTAISVAFKYAAEAQSELNIHVVLGVKMWVFMWLATGFSVWAFAVHSGMGCCCTSRRDLKIGRRVVREGRTERQ
ncbi:hypothetical protein N0V88_000958 [Collariella sp. IMI 366227]|nr:hypothetical protein N0V88_000958 [Collariella sp. IMI 366227]